MHFRSWCRQKCIDFSDHPQCIAKKGTYVVLTTFNYKVAMKEGLANMHQVNAFINPIGGPFVVVGDPECSEI